MAEDSDQESKTEEASGKRLSDARNKGQMARSQEVKHLFSLLGCLIVCMVFISDAAMSMMEFLSSYLEHAGTVVFDSRNLSELTHETLFRLLGVLGIPFAVLAVMGIAGSALQTGGFMWSAEALRVDIGNLSPMKGWKKLFSAQSVVELLKSMLKMAIIGGMLVWLIRPVLDHAEDYVTMPLPELASEILRYALKLAGAVAVCVGFLAAVDYIYQFFAFRKKMRMTKEEVKEEHKQMDGDPRVKGKLKQLRMQKARQRMMANVPKADVVITNPTHYAVALQYNQDDMNAPVCLAKGVDLISQRIRDLAKEHDIPIVSNPPLARSLYQTAEIDKEIPVEHYKAVAEVISFVFRLRGNKPKAGAKS